MMTSLHRRFLTPATAVLLCVILLLVAQDLSRSFDYHSIVHTLKALPSHTIALAVLATTVSYIGLIARDAAGLRSMGSPVPVRFLLTGAIAGSALGNVAGFGAITGGAVRVRIYGAAGLTPAGVARLTVITASTFGLGLVLLGGAGALFAAPRLAPLLGFPEPLIRAAGLAGCAAPIGLTLLARQPRTFRFRSVVLDWPGRGPVFWQLAFVALDVIAAGVSLWVLLPPAPVGFVSFLAIYAVALLLGVAGHTPGGIGVFEAAVVIALGNAVPAGPVVAALLCYRAVYFLLPLIVSAALLAGFEASRIQIPTARIARLAPLYLSVITFALGIMLVMSGATPAFGKRLALLQANLPLWVVEGSQFFASITGVLLLFVARGLLRRLDGGWWLAITLAVVGLALSLAKGLAFVEAAFLACLIALLFATRRQFHRRASLLHRGFAPTWLVSIAIVMMVAIWMVFFAFRNVPYSHDLWWQFAFDDKAPRALRATFGAAFFAAALALWQLLRPEPGRAQLPSDSDLADAERIIRAQDRSDAMLAMMGDKSLLFSPSRRSLLMYVKRGRTWLALHDPIGPANERRALIRAFITLAHEHGGRAAFYQVRAESLPLYLDAGLKLLKLGEEARISLRDFDLRGGQRTNLRYAIKRGERDGLTAELIPAPQMPAAMATFGAISDAWLAGRGRREKGFSVAAFSPRSLLGQSAMLVRQNGRPVAFAAFMTTETKAEATVGVMRRCPDASSYAMEYLFTRLALHLKDSGTLSLSLGVAPLSGVEPGPLASTWHSIAALLWRHGGAVYNFRGLRSFKNKFDPVWEPRYLAASGTIGQFLSLGAAAQAAMP